MVFTPVHGTFPEKDIGLSCRSCTSCRREESVKILSGMEMLRKNLRSGGPVRRRNFPWFRAEWTGALCLKITGGLFWGQASGFAVRPGERYLLSYDLKGEGGSLGVVYTIYDGKKKKLFPKREGINALSIKGSSGWKRYSEIIEIHENQAAEMKIALLANYRKTEKNATIWVDNVRVVRLTDKISPAKALYRGEFLLTEKPPKIDGDLREWTNVPSMILKEDVQVVRKACKVWNGPQDLSAKMQVMMDSANLYLAVTVNDDQIALPEKVWKHPGRPTPFKSGIDPYCEGREMHQLLLARNEKGRLKVWKHRNFFTPEIPMGSDSARRIEGCGRCVPSGRGRCGL